MIRSITKEHVQLIAHAQYSLTVIVGRAAENESLFTYTGGRTYESYQNLNFVPTFDIPANIDPTITQLCKSNSDCIYDYYVTANRRFGQMSANVSDEFARISSYTIPGEPCL